MRKRSNYSTHDKAMGFGLIILLAMGLVFLAGWVTHIVASIGLITAGSVAIGVALLIFGIVVFPIGIIHGIGVWFGLF